MCFQEGLGTWPEAGPLGTEIWASGGGGEIRMGKGTGEWEEVGGKCHGMLSVSGVCV